jgi:hypothetical protein
MYLKVKKVFLLFFSMFYIILAWFYIIFFNNLDKDKATKSVYKATKSVLTKLQNRC